uniref:VWFA domain-containing protein n=1 Tax=Panagrellus redivivus TaxID=6233 RepID=A0A7E4V298_PANRE
MDEDDEPRHSHLRARRRRCLTSTMWYFLVVIHVLIAFTGSAQSQVVTASSVSKIGDELSRHLSKTFKDATKWEDIIRVYNKLTEPEVFDPKAELERIKKQIEDYLRERAKMAWDAKISLESRPLYNRSSDELNNQSSSDFIRYFNAKTEDNSATLYVDGHLGPAPTTLNATIKLDMQPNVNFYGIRTSSDHSVVHIPTPIFNREAELLERIEWSEIDQLYRRNREKIKDLSFQKFCSNTGFMRYFPAAPWIYDNPLTQLDLFDCRTHEWYIDAGTNSKNMIIMLDMSGSMLGQRFEIAKQTIEAILETLSDNDFVNIMSFSKEPRMLDNCPLIQATTRNKKELRKRLMNVTSEGKAEYEKALGQAFKTLLDIRNDSRHSSGPQTGCNDVIMLITDGAPGYYKETFELWNANRKVRFFSFLIGEEAIDFDQVKWMACTNRGYMVHVSNMADVQEKIQHYVSVMSRPISRQTKSMQKSNAVWGSVTKERMSNQYVISVGYPVVHGSEFMGVAAVSLPIIELIQIAHPSLLGSTSYFFMLDNNGYAMFHPQLRPIDPVTRETKPTYNNMDFLHVEVQRPLSELQDIALVNCENEDETKMSVLYAINDMKRVYQQRNYYIAKCIAETHFTIGAAIAEGDDVRLIRRQKFHYKDVELRWFEEKNWRVHPEWRYCLLNDSDTSLSAEAAITTYARQMRMQGKLPKLCEPRKELVDRLLLDLEASNSFADLWDQEWQENRKNGVHLAFFAAPSGLIRYFNESLEDAWYEEADFATNHTDKAYKHFILELNKRSSDDDYFKRAVRMKGKTVFDVNLQTYLWQATEAFTAYGTDENQTMLGVAYRALYHDQALIGVVGMEFLYDKMVGWLRTHGCDPNNDQVRCFLLDENAYIYYSSQRDINYEGTLKEHEYSQKNRRYTKTSPIGRFFGHLNRATEWTMEMLVKKGFYKKVNFVDNQAMCDQKVIPKSSGAAVITVPLTHLKNIILYMATQLLQVLAKYAVFIVTSMFSSTVPSAAAYTTTFKPSAGNRNACLQQSPFYIADTEHTKMASASLLEGDSAERPCMRNAAQCAIRVYAHWVEKTNLLLVVISQDQQSACYDETQCQLSTPSPIPFGFTEVNDTSTNDTEKLLNQGECQHVMPTQRKNVMECIVEPYVNESHLPCSISPSLHSTSKLAVLATVFLSLFIFA